jgi:hypothetical protein
MMLCRCRSLAPEDAMARRLLEGSNSCAGEPEDGRNPEMKKVVILAERRLSGRPLPERPTPSSGTIDARGQVS